MFNKALFKQSCKANWIMWLIVTIAVCFMLACVMLISGRGNITEMKEGISDTIITSEIDTSMQKRALNYYNIDIKALETFDTAFVSSYSSNPDTASAVLSAKNAVDAYYNGVLSAKDIKADSTTAQEIQGVIYYVLNLNGMFDEFYTDLGVTAPQYNLSTLTDPNSAERIAYRQNYVRDNATTFLAGNAVSESNIDLLVSALSSFGVTKDSFAKFTYATQDTEGATIQAPRYVGTYGFKYIKSLSVDVVNTYVARLNYDVSTGKNPADASLAIEEDLTASFLSSVPQDVSDALFELGQMDLYSMIVGSIFFKMAGLLLPIIYMIMASNNLVAGQVDSGSMAYVLSTSTKRKQVMFTQALYLVSSLFAMFTCTFVTSFVCFHFVDLSNSTLTYPKLLLLNVGAFLTMFAMSGISFFASCWFNRSKYSMSVGGGLNIFFLVATMLGLFGSKVLPSVIRLKSLNAFNYVSIISLFDVVSILDKTGAFVWKFAILVVVGLVGYIFGARKFVKKDLPL